MCFDSGDYGAGAAEAQYNLKKQQVAESMANVDKAFSGYDPAFYQQRAQAYVDSATPKLLQDYQQTKAATGFNLANKGLVQSSAGARLGDLLTRELSTQKQNIVDTGQQQADALQQQVEGFRNQVVGQIQSAVDPVATGQAALRGAASFAAPSAAQPLANAGSLFGNWAQQYLLANQAAASPYSNEAIGLGTATGGNTGANFGY